jgi:hypothetical protein
MGRKRGNRTPAVNVGNVTSSLWTPACWLLPQDLHLLPFPYQGNAHLYVPRSIKVGRNGRTRTYMGVLPRHVVNL